MALFDELKRRNVFRVGIAYLVSAWLLLQVADLVLDAIAAPDWAMRALLVAIAVGLPITLMFAWAYEITPEGIKSEKDVDRSQSITARTGQRLNRLTIVILLIAVAVLLIDKYFLRQAPDAHLAGTGPNMSVAVLPFVAMSRGPDDEYFADGLTEEILNSLTQVPELLVTARTSAFAFKGQDVPIPDIAAKLGVAHVVEGSVRRDGERLRVTAQLIRADDGFHLWSETYDRPTANSFDVQSEIAEKIASALDIVLDENQLARMRSVGLRNPEAFIAYQKGTELYDLSHGNAAGRQLAMLTEANTWFDKALALEPALFDAYVRHSDLYAHLLMHAGAGGAVSAEEQATAMLTIEDDFDRAIDVAPDEKHRLSAAFDLGFLTGRWHGLNAMIDEIMNQPGCEQPGWASVISLPYGRARDALLMQEKQIACDPLYFSGWDDSVQAYIWLGEFDNAIDIARKGLEAVPHNAIRTALVMALAAAEQFEQARTIIDRDVRQQQGSLYLRARVAAAVGDAGAAQAMLRDYDDAGFDENDERIVMLAIAGNHEGANQLAAGIDAGPYGYLLLGDVILHCICGAPFDLESTPNFARLIKDANLSWPPQTPIDWPLKDW